MRSTLTAFSFIALLVLSVISICTGAPAAQKKKEPYDIKVGITEYQNLPAVLERYKSFFGDAELAATKSGIKLHFSIAIGTYEEVLNWRHAGDIDLAVLSAAPVATLLVRGSDADKTQLSLTYVGRLAYGVGPPPYGAKTDEPQLPVAELDGRKSNWRSGFYSSFCVVRQKDNFHSFAEVIAAAKRGEVKFFFVRPYSVSGYLHPRHVLRENAIYDLTGEAEFTGDHSSSVAKLLEDVSGADRRKPVAFVQDSTLVASKKASQLQLLRIPELDGQKIPQEAIFLSPKYEADPVSRTSLLGVLQKTFLEITRTNLSQECDENSHPCFLADRNQSNWQQDYTAVQDDVQAFFPPDLQFRANLTDLLTEFEVYKVNNPKARLALVLSGGGAKCAYQVGALKKIQEEFAKKGRSFDLVVGTSGGAINAFMTTLGVQNLDRIWEKVDQRDLVRASTVNRMLLGLAGATFVFGGVIGLCLLIRKWRKSTTDRWVRWAAVLCLAAAVLGLVLNSLSIQKLVSHWFYHGLLLAHLGSWSFVVALLGMCLLLLKPVRSRIGNHLLFFNILGGAAFLASLFFLLDTFWLENSVTDLSGEADALIENLQARYPGLSEQLKNDLTPEKKLEDISRQIIKLPGEKSDLGNDLIVTVSVLPADNKPVPVQNCKASAKPANLKSDLYFYFEADAHQRSGDLPGVGDTRFISLRQNREKLLQVVLGSSTIYPFFSAQKLECVKLGRVADLPNSAADPDQVVPSIEVVDGGFSHNSPVDAAVSWGATHIILINSSPRPHYDAPKSLLAHMTNAFDYLYNQAQRTDSRARADVEIFELSPSTECDEPFEPTCMETQPWLDVLDFSRPLLERAIRLGESDANPEHRHFVRLPGPPFFFKVGREEHKTPAGAPIAEK